MFSAIVTVEFFDELQKIDQNFIAVGEQKDRALFAVPLFCAKVD